MAGEKPSAKQGADPMSSRSMISQPPPEGAFRTVISWLRNARRRRDGAANGFVTPEAPRIVWFHRGHAALTGGQVKHSHYFEHVLRMPGFSRRITFSKEPSNETRARERRQLWPAGDDTVVERWEPACRDLLFLEGMDWPYLAENGLMTLANPRINLIQGVRHARAQEQPLLYHYLAERAVRICVSQEVADAISATGRTRGPVLTIPNGVDVAPFEPAGEGSPAGYEKRRRLITIVGYKSPDLARDLSERLDAERIDHLLVMKFVHRDAFLGLLAESRGCGVPAL